MLKNSPNKFGKKMHQLKSTKGKDKKRLTRKQRRKEDRRLKKAKRHAFFSKKSFNTETLQNELKDAEVKDQMPNQKKKQEVQNPKQKVKKKKADITPSEIRRKQLLLENKIEEKNIKMLEKKMKMNRRKTKSLPKIFVNDGLDYLLDVCDSEKLSSLEPEPDLFVAESDLDEDVADLLQTNQPETEKKGRKKAEVEKQNSIVENQSIISESSDLEESVDDVVSSELESLDGEASENIKKPLNQHDLQQKCKNTNKRKKGKDDDQDSLLLKKKVKFNLPVSSDDEANDASSEDFTEKKPGVKMADKDVCENSENEDDDEEEEGSSSSDENTKEKLWEDIYGRLRDTKGNIVNISEDSQKNEISKKVYLENNKQDSEERFRLKKQLKGLMNRLSEANIQPISSQIEELFTKYSRNEMNETLTQIIKEAIVQPNLTPERLIQEHAMLVAYLHANVGTEVGAYFLQELVKNFCDLQEKPEDGKESQNVLLLIAHLYNFKVVNNLLLFNILQKLAETFSEKDIENILVLLRSVGFTLRKDDPAALKDIILQLQSKASSVSSKVDESRVRFMLETLMAIRNNNMHKIPNYDPTHVEHLKKLLRGIIRKGCSLTELHISLQDLLKADQKGRWWIVGSAWEGNNPGNNEHQGEKSNFTPSQGINNEILMLAIKQRMNTDIRKNIFCVIMTAEDYLDCFEKLMRLGLTQQQQREIVHVIINCCLQEAKFNPYYAYLSSKFCKFDRRFQLAYQYSFWDHFKELKKYKKQQLSNLSQLLSHLLLTNDLALSVLKVLEFAEMDKTTVKLLRQILLSLLLTESDEITSVFNRISSSPKLHLLREGLRLFMHHFLLRQKETLNSDLREKLEKNVRVAEKALTAIDSKVKL